MNTRGWFIGEGALLVRCAEVYAKAGHTIAGIATSDPVVARWAGERGTTAIARSPALVAALRQSSFDYLFSIGNQAMLPDEFIGAPSRAALNFHYGPLPTYAGVHVPVWALLNGEPRYGVTWHEMTAGVDAGRIVTQVMFDIPPGETAAGLNARCFEAGVETFRSLVDDLANDGVTFTPQDSSRRTVFRRHDRPAHWGIVDWAMSGEEIGRLVRALDFGRMENPFGVPRFLIGTGALILSEIGDSTTRACGAAPGTIVAVDPETVTVATRTSPVSIRGLRRLTGERLSIADAVREFGSKVGDVLSSPTPEHLQALLPAFKAATRHEANWLAQLSRIVPVVVPYANSHPAGDDRVRSRVRIPMDLPVAALEQLGASLGADPETVLLALAAAYVTHLVGATELSLPLATDHLAQQDGGPGRALLSDCIPVHTDLDCSWVDHLRAVNDGRLAAETLGSFFVDMCARYHDRPGLGAFGQWRRGVVLCVSAAPERPQSSALAMIASPGGSRLMWDASPAVFTEGAVQRMQREFRAFLGDLSSHPEKRLASVSRLDPAERHQVLVEWNSTDRDVPAACVHELFEAQVRRTPDARALSFRDQALSYRDLNRHANRLAARLRGEGIGPDGVVGVFVDRSLEMVVALLGILKAGGAYLPLDPAFPQERLAGMLEDTSAAVIVTQPHLVETLPRHQGTVLTLDLDSAPDEDRTNIASGVTPAHLAYVIFTSGSTGRPKGVMVEHRQVVNFFVGMDEYLGGRTPGTWLAVTSISFDISVLELFWTLARGFTVVIQEELVKAAGEDADGQAVDERGMDFSLFYFSADARRDDGNRYRLLLEGAKYADAHGFRAVWTPERHFHEFGGLYPNPAVTSAAIAAVTSNIRIRAGSVVLPLHNPIRVAEEWAVVDQLSGGRVELSFASGWHANDFALMPQNYKDRRDIMLSGIETIRRLWRGESVSVTNGNGEPIEVKVYPAPMQERPPFWISAAGNVETFRTAGRLGAYLLTNLLGQKAEEVGAKIAAYRAAWHEAGHAGHGVVALMLHAFVGPNLDEVRDTVRRPLIDYLKTSTELVKQTRWEFPAFANPSGKQVQAGEVELTPDEVDAMMSHAFERYFQTSGLFGTPEMCLERVQALKALGVDEIACLVDFGIATDTVLSHLPYLDEVRERSRPRRVSSGDYTIATQIARHRVTHLQGTPSLIRTVLADERGRTALSDLTTILVGGEPLPPALATEILSLSRGELLNMYGPTETTVWSSVARITDGGDVTIGRPIANTQIYIVNAAGSPQPVGTPGELLIGGLGVTRGYWRRAELTAERFVRNTCLSNRADTLYRTGDLARYRVDGRIECLGRVDHQVKISGHRIELGEIEAVLGSHPHVAQSVVAVKADATGEPRLIAYVVSSKKASNAGPSDVLGWQTVWEETYGDRGPLEPGGDPTFDISGWRSSYTGDPMPEAEMREWLEATVARVLSLEPRRILEIGCGTGLLLHRIAPSVDHYAAIYFSETALARVQQIVDARGVDNVTLRLSTADALAAQADLSPVDVVIINSVAQYFPNVEYLVRVLEQAVSCVRPGGAVFVGDVRNLSLLEAFHASVELAQAPASMTVADLRQRVRDRVQHDPELVIAPDLFRALASHLPVVTSVDILLKRGHARNEMTCYRYDVVLRVGGREAETASEINGRGFSIPDVRAVLTTSRGAVTIRGIGNPRLTADVQALRLSASPDCPETVAALRHQLGAVAAIEPEDLIAEAAGREVDLRYAASGALDEYDATFRPAGVSSRPRPAATEPVRPWSSYVHQPHVDRGQLVQSLKQHLRARVPVYMVPTAFVLLESLPLTPNGKIDRNALPEPDRQRQEVSFSYVAPGTDVERLVAVTWQELLALDRIGAHDNFFDIGANSLLMVQAHTVLREKLGRPVSLVDLFRFPTVSALAAFLSQSETAAGSAVLTDSEARAQARTEALGRRQGRQVARAGSPTKAGTT